MDGGAWWAAVHGVAKGRTWLRDFTFTFRFQALEKEMATHSSVLAWRIPGTGEPVGCRLWGPHRVGHYWNDLAAAASTVCLSLWVQKTYFFSYLIYPTGHSITVHWELNTFNKCVIPLYRSNVTNLTNPLQINLQVVSNLWQLSIMLQFTSLYRDHFTMHGCIYRKNS